MFETSSSITPVIAVIPARGGSKSVPRKNLQDLGGSPLISYSIDAAFRCQSIHQVYVSTDDLEIAQVSKSYGAKVLNRPQSMATDTSRDDELLKHAITTEFSKLAIGSLFVFLRPSHPLRNPDTIDLAVRTYLANTQYDSLRSMKNSVEIPYKMWRVVQGGAAIPVVDSRSIAVFDPPNAPRQILPQTYYQDGYVEVFPFSTVLSFGNTSGMKVLPFIINEFSHDIDTYQDIEIINSKLADSPLPSWFKKPTPQL